MSRLVYERGASRKFWQGSVSGSTLKVRFGRLGTDGQVREKKLASAAVARAALAAVIAEKLGKGYAPEKGAAARSPKAAKPKPAARTTKPAARTEKPAARTEKVAPARRTAVLALASELGGRALVREVTVAADDPARYRREFRARTANIGEATNAELPWQAMLEAAVAQRRCVEIDWREEAESVVSRIQRLVGKSGRQALAAFKARGALDACRTDEALERFGKALASVQLALVELEKESDSYVVTVRSAREVAALTALARKAGGKLRWINGSALSTIAKERQRETAKASRDKAKAATGNKWAQLAEAFRKKATRDILWTLRHPPYPLPRIRAALGDAPAKDQPLIRMVVAVHDKPATTIARTTDDPTLCLRALEFLGQEARFAAQRLGAAAILAERLRIPPKGGRLALQLAAACNLFGAEARVERARLSLPPDARVRLARAADALLARAESGSDEMHSAVLMMCAVGDKASLPGIVAARTKSAPGYEERRQIEAAIARVRKRKE
jgi:predicted DNA-binding WGR domain protein